MTRRALTLAIACLSVLLVAEPARAAWTWPVQGDVITSYRNGDDPYAAGQHRGIDIAAVVGTPAVAAVGGEVRFAGAAGSSGLTVSVRTSDGLYDTSYLHLSATSVRKGDSVAAGDRVGAVGATGIRSATQPHLHFGVRDAGTAHAYRDPLLFLPPPGTVPERPRPGPVPAPAPVSPEPGRVPSGAPRPVPRTAPRPAPRTAPHLAPRTAPHPEPRTAPHPEPRTAHHPEPRTAPHRAPRTAPHSAPRPSPSTAPHSKRRPLPHAAPDGPRVEAPTPRGAPNLDRPQPRSSGSPAHTDSPAARPSLHAGPTRPGPVASEPSAQPGPDIGWVLACLGLLAAAALIGLTEDGRKATRTAAGRARRRVAALAKPQLGGR